MYKSNLNSSKTPTWADEFQWIIFCLQVWFQYSCAFFQVRTLHLKFKIGGIRQQYKRSKGVGFSNTVLLYSTVSKKIVCSTLESAVEKNQSLDSSAWRQTCKLARGHIDGITTRKHISFHKREKYIYLYLMSKTVAYNKLEFNLFI